MAHVRPSPSSTPNVGCLREGSCRPRVPRACQAVINCTLRCQRAQIQVLHNTELQYIVQRLGPPYNTESYAVGMEWLPVAAETDPAYGASRRQRLRNARMQRMRHACKRLGRLLCSVPADWAALPRELLVCCLSKVDVRSLKRAAIVCQQWQVAAREVAAAVHAERAAKHAKRATRKTRRAALHAAWHACAANCDVWLHVDVGTARERWEVSAAQCWDPINSQLVHGAQRLNLPMHNKAARQSVCVCRCGVPLLAEACAVVDHIVTPASIVVMRE